MKKNIWIITIALLVLFCIGFAASDDSNSISTGDRVVVIKATWGAIDDNAFDELLDVANVGDEIGIFELQMQGKIEYIKQGRHGKVIRRKVTKEQIRFDDGSLYWVPSSTIEKAK